MIIKRRKKVNVDANAEIYRINKEYRIVSLKGNKCSLFFKNKQNMLRATLDGCDKFLNTITINSEKDLSDEEKGYLLSFIRAKDYSLSKEAADVLGVSIIKYEDGREEYLSQRLLLKRIASGLNFAKVYVGKLKIYQLDIPEDTRNVSYNLAKAEIVKLVVGENCAINIDLRDNDYVESLQVRDKFTGTLSLSRTSLESVFIGNNCRCNMVLSDSKKCLNVQIADICSGNINITNSCMYALAIGYYSYADVMLSNNVIKKEITIGDAFRGGIYATNQNAEIFRLGNDFKGWIKLNNQMKSVGVDRLEVGYDFAGNINMSGDNSIRTVNIGDKNTGKLIASYASMLERVNLGKYFNGNVDLSGSSTHEMYVGYGASGRINLQGCKNFKVLQASVDNDLYIDGDIKSVDALSDENYVSYYFEDIKPRWRHVPFYKRIYNSWANRSQV